MVLKFERKENNDPDPDCETCGGTGYIKPKKPKHEPFGKVRGMYREKNWCPCRRMRIVPSEVKRPKRGG